MDIPKIEMRLHEGELNVMELLWSNKELAAKDISKIIKEYIGWEKNTTYTVIKRLIDKGAIERIEPGFIVSRSVSLAPSAAYIGHCTFLLQQNELGGGGDFCRWALAERL